MQTIDVNFCCTLSTHINTPKTAMCPAAKIYWPVNIRSVYGFSGMPTTHDVVNDVLLEDRLVQMWPDCPCLYDVRATSSNTREVRQLAMEERL